MSVGRLWDFGRFGAQRLPGRTPENADSYADPPLFDLGAPVGRPLGPKTPSRQAPWSPRRSPGRPLGPPDAPPGRPMGPKTPSRQASGTQDALPAGLWGPRRPPGKSPGAQDALLESYLGFRRSPGRSLRTQDALPTKLSAPQKSF